MSEKKERLKRKLASDRPAQKRSCSACPWWGLSPVNLSCPQCGKRTRAE